MLPKRYPVFSRRAALKNNSYYVCVCGFDTKDVNILSVTVCTACERTGLAVWGRLEVEVEQNCQKIYFRLI